MLFGDPTLELKLSVFLLLYYEGILVQFQQHPESVFPLGTLAAPLIKNNLVCYNLCYNFVGKVTEK